MIDDFTPTLKGVERFLIVVVFYLIINMLKFFAPYFKSKADFDFDYS